MGRTKRRITLALLLALVVVFPAKIVATSPPDIVIVMVDDLGAIDDRVLERLPNIKSLFLDNGLHFAEYYSETPLCCPSRASFLTGQHTRRHHVTYNDARLLNPHRTLFTALKDVGYQTALIGKYLNKVERLSDKTPPGYDHTVLMKTLPVGGTSTGWFVDGADATGGYVDRVVLNESMAWVRRLDPGRPFALWATPRAPHFARPVDWPRPWVPLVEDRYRDDPRCSGIEPWQPPAYTYLRKPDGFPLQLVCESLLTVDEMVGGLRHELERQGRSPIWVFASDNGMAYGWHGYPAKNVPEAGRVPLYFSGPGVVHGTSNALLSNIDLGPTLAQLAGAAMPWADGKPFTGLLEGRGGGRQWMLEDHPRGGRTFRAFDGTFWGIRTPTWHLVAREFDGRWFVALYDLKNDPWEQHDVKAGNLEVARSLRSLLPYLWHSRGWRHRALHGTSD